MCARYSVTAGGADIISARKLDSCYADDKGLPIALEHVNKRHDGLGTRFDGTTVE